MLTVSYISVMQPLQERLEVLISKAQKLVDDNRRLASKNQVLEQELAEYRQKLGESAQKNEELLEKIKIIKLAQNIGSGPAENEQVTELKRKINEYIKEIDNCIAMLND